MSDTVIRVENISKKYVLSHQQERRSNHKSLREAISNKANKARALGKKIIKPASDNEMVMPAREEFWALKDVSFEIKQGDCVGIIGRNGAGKSTLLKILSRITEPTSGAIRIKGRVASLLEVGTGFHPELTGRENIFLNGSILGMSKVEIQRKFDEIVDFAEIEKFLDTPVKRYSSGMYVRLAFAVAAHLEPEILIIDEVLSVGDAQFQKKCLGKMGDVASKEGRTVLFVSHNMPTVRRLCNSTILLNGGKVSFRGSTEEGIGFYLKAGMQDKPSADVQLHQSGTHSGAAFTRVRIIDSDGIPNTTLKYEEPFLIELTIECHDVISRSVLGITINSLDGTPLFTTHSDDLSNSRVSLKEGLHIMSCNFKPNPLLPGQYYINIGLVDHAWNLITYAENVLQFEVLDIGHTQNSRYYRRPGKIILPFNWS